MCAGAESCCDAWWGEGCSAWAERACCQLCRPTRCDNSYNVLTASDVEITAVLDGFTVSGGEVNDGAHHVGGGLTSVEGSPTIRDCLFVDNAPAGIYALHGEPRIADCDFVENGWYVGAGGVGAWNESNEVEVTGCRFIRNRGLGLYKSGSKPLVGCMFVENVGGGGLLTTDGAPNIIDCLFVGNVSGHNGGGMYNRAYTQLINCGFYGNSAGSEGGGLFHRGSGVILINCVFSGNRAGGYVPFPGAEPNPGFGGAVSQYDGGMLVLNSTFYGNSAGHVGGVRAYVADVAQSVFWGNTCEDEYCGSGTDLEQVHGWDLFIEHSWIGGNDPLFIDADGPDGIVGTEDDNLRLSPESPLINAGDPDPPLAPYMDADGHERILCGRIDIGAYEFGIGDYDCNRVLDLLDLMAWDACMTGPDVGPFDPGCEAFDFDASVIGDIDLKDFAGFQRALPGGIR